MCSEINREIPVMPFLFSFPGEICTRVLVSIMLTQVRARESTHCDKGLGTKTRFSSPITVTPSFGCFTNTFSKNKHVTEKLNSETEF